MMCCSSALRTFGFARSFFLRRAALCSIISSVLTSSYTHGSGDPVKAPAFREHEAREHDAEKDQQAQRQRQLAAPGQILRPE